VSGVDAGAFADADAVSADAWLSAVWPAGCVPASCPEAPWLGVLVARAAPITALLAAVTVAAAAATGDWLAGAEPVPEPPDEPDELAEAAGAGASCAEPPWLGVLAA
jgi:hypothetical protein